MPTLSLNTLPLKHLLVAASFLITTACSSIKTSYDYNKEIDFAQYKTFGWLEAKNTDKDDTAIYASDELIVSRIHNAVKANLEAKGLVFTEENPELGIGHHMSSKRKMSVRTMNTYYGYGHYNAWGTVGFDTYVTDYEIGTLVIDIADINEKSLVWRGSSSKVVDDNPSAAEIDKTIHEAVNKILENFPPAAK